MAQRFFVSDLSGGLVKQILCQTNLPVVRTISYGEWMIAGMQYQLASSVVLCTQSGVYPGGTPAVGVDLRCDEDVICDDSLAVDEITQVAIPSPVYTGTATYRLGERTVGLSKPFYSLHDYYDTETHEQLGRYLRCIRDMKGLNLMPFYNCFSYKSIEGISLKRLTSDSAMHELAVDNPAVKVFAVPVRLGATYTICLNCPTALKMGALLYSNLGVLSSGTSGEASKALYLNTYSEYDSVTFNNPIVLTIPYPEKTVGQHTEVDSTVAKSLLAYEGNLHLLIQMPAGTNTSIVVLEGDYSDKSVRVINSGYAGAEYTYEDENFALLSNLSLMQPTLEAGSPAFSDRLLEYLTLNVISSLDEISQNTISVAERMRKPDNKLIDAEQTSVGIYTTGLRASVFNKYAISRDASSYTAYDLTGYVDKDIEDDFRLGGKRL